MNIPHAISLLREASALPHFSFKTETTCTYWVGRYGGFLHHNRLTAATTEQKMEIFLTRLANEGVAATPDGWNLSGD
jgi:hypothetical protein